MLRDSHRFALLVRCGHIKFSADYPTAEPSFFAFKDGAVIIFPGKKGSLTAACVKDLRTALELVEAGNWRPYPDRPGKRTRLRRSLRLGKRPTTQYAHQWLFGENARCDQHSGRAEKLKPVDGDYLNLLPENFQPEPRTDEEMKPFLEQVWTLWPDMMRKATLALHDSTKAHDAVAATFDHVERKLRARRGIFQNENKFVGWVFVTLRGKIRERLNVKGDVIRSYRELKLGTTADAVNLKELPAGYGQVDIDADCSGSMVSILSQEWVDPRPARPTPVPKEHDDEDNGALRCLVHLTRLPRSKSKREQWQSFAVSLRDDEVED
jgi:hypothetical protein